MKKPLILILLLSSIFFTICNAETKNDDLTKKNIKEQLEKEAKYKKEQAFYHGEKYDLKEAEVNEESLKSIPNNRRDNDDFDMNSVYD